MRVNRCSRQSTTSNRNLSYPNHHHSQRHYYYCFFLVAEASIPPIRRKVLFLSEADRIRRPKRSRCPFRCATGTICGEVVVVLLSRSRTSTSCRFRFSSKEVP